MLMIERVTEDEIKAGYKCAIKGDITQISLEYFLLAKNIIKVFDEKNMGFLFKGFVEDMLPLLLSTVGKDKLDSDSIAKMLSKVIGGDGDD